MTPTKAVHVDPNEGLLAEGAAFEVELSTSSPTKRDLFECPQDDATYVSHMAATLTVESFPVGELHAQLFRGDLIDGDGEDVVMWADNISGELEAMASTLL